MFTRTPTLKRTLRDYVVLFLFFFSIIRVRIKKTINVIRVRAVYDTENETTDAVPGLKFRMVSGEEGTNIQKHPLLIQKFVLRQLFRRSAA